MQQGILKALKQRLPRVIKYVVSSNLCLFIDYNVGNGQVFQFSQFV